MSHEKLLAALPLAAVFAAVMLHQNARAAGQEGMVVVRDAQTGQMRAPTAAELKALGPAPVAKLRAQPPSASMVVTRQPNGSRSLRLGENGLVYSVVQRDADGSLVEQCVKGKEAADEALVQPAKPRNHQELRHEDR